MNMIGMDTLTIGEDFATLASHVVGYIVALGLRTAARCFPALMGTTPLTILEENGSTNKRDVSVCSLRYLNARLPFTTITSIFR
jgi:hypothetical protein